MKRKATAKRLTAVLLVLLLLSSTLLTAQATTYTAGSNVPIYMDFCVNFQLKERNAAGFPWMATQYCYAAENGATLKTDGDWLYCIDYYNHAQQGLANSTATDLTKTSVWMSLSGAAQRGITYALLYGCPHYSNEVYGYAATQLIIWEYQLGYRTSPTDSVSFFSATLSSGGTRLKTAYNEILSRMAQHDKAPSFSGQTVTLKGYGRANSVTLTDTNGLFKNDTWSIAGSSNGVAIEQSGNQLLVYANEALAPDGKVTVALKRNFGFATGSAVCAKSGAQTVITGVPADPLAASFTVKMEAGGTMQLSKATTAASGGISGYEFKIWGSATNTTWYGRSSVNGAIFEIDGEGGNGYLGSDNDYYTFEGLQDGQFSFRELLSQRPDDPLFPDSWVVTVTDTSGETVYTHSFTEEELHKDTNGDCYTSRITVTGLTGGGRMTVTINNAPQTEDLEIIKTSPDGKVDGIEFTVQDSGGAVVGTGKTDDSGKLTIPGLRIGATYTVTETVPDGYLCTKNPQTVTIAEGTNTVTFENRPIFGNIELTKVDEEYPENKLTAAEFTVTIQKDGTTSTQKMVEDKDASGKGTGVYRLEHIAYGSVCTIRETAAPVGFVLSPETFTVTILEEKTYTVSSANFDAVVNRPIEGSLKLVKIDRSGETPLEGAGFRVYNSSGKKVAEGYTDQNGALEFKGLRYGNYTYQEFAAPDGFELDDTVYDFSILQDGQTISVKQENDAIAGSIRIYKVNAEAQPLSGVSFLLEYSTDGGKTYQPVFFRDETAPVTTGGCTSARLNDGVLITGEDGIAVFTGLRIDTQTGKIRYRLTETKTQDSYQLLSGPAFEGELPADEEIDVELTVVNNHSYELPATGGSGFPFLPLSLVTLALSAVLLGFALHKKRREV